MRAILLMDRGHLVPQWKYDALKEAIEAGLEIVLVAHCRNTHTRVVKKSNIAYYAFASVSHRGLRAKSPVSIVDLVVGVPEVEFDASHEGMWERIPSEIAARFTNAEVVIKYGMTLLRGVDDLPLVHGVLSYHNGDPARFRGRPAGFYEILEGVPTQGVIVQRLSDTLDGGAIVARGTSRVVPHSYRQTLENSFRAGVPLLAQALRALEEGERVSCPETLGKNYRLPATRTVARQVVRLGRRKLSRVGYGLLKEKRWRIGVADIQWDPESDILIRMEDLSDIPNPSGFTFAADPFVMPDGSVIAELMDGARGVGTLGVWRDSAWSVDLFSLAGHASYPQVVEDNGAAFIFPETSSFAPPSLWEMNSAFVPTGKVTALQGLEADRVVDGTLFERDGSWYLFGGRPGSAGDRLELWFAERLAGPYRLHPISPICIDVRRARMGGPIHELGGRLYRLGQNSSENYGGSLSVSRIDELSLYEYNEVPCGSLHMVEGWGPHTAGVTKDGLLIDYFQEVTTPGAGLRRVAGRVATWKARGLLSVIGLHRGQR